VCGAPRTCQNPHLETTQPTYLRSNYKVVQFHSTTHKGNIDFVCFYAIDILSQCTDKHLHGVLGR